MYVRLYDKIKVLYSRTTMLLSKAEYMHSGTLLEEKKKERCEELEITKFKT